MQEKILALMSFPRTDAEIAVMLNIPISKATEQMQALARQGKVTRSLITEGVPRPLPINRIS